MNELRKVDKAFAKFYETQKIIWKKDLNPNITKNLYEKEKDIIREQIIASYIDVLEKKKEPIKLSSSHVSQCYRVSPFIIRKSFLAEDDRINWEINALNKLEIYPCFPKILYLNMKRRVFYMNDVGTPLKYIHSTKELPKDLLEQADIMIRSLKKAEVFHRDLSLEHLCINKEGKLSLIDFEKCFLSKEDYENNKAKNTSSWQKLKYYDMNHIRVMINAFHENLLLKEKEKAAETAAKFKAQQKSPEITVIPKKTTQNVFQRKKLQKPRPLDRTQIQNRRRTLQPFRTFKGL